MNRIPTQFLNQVATYRFTENGPYGPTLSDPVEVQCRFEPAHRTITTMEGDTILGSATMFVEPEIDLPVGTVVEYGGKSYKVIQVDTMVNAVGGYHHREITLQ